MVLVVDYINLYNRLHDSHLNVTVQPMPNSPLSPGQEVMYMQYLLDPPLLIGEPGYYLTTLASSIILLKSLNFDKPQHILPTVGHLQSMLQIHFTDPDMEVCVIVEL